MTSFISVWKPFEWVIVWFPKSTFHPTCFRLIRTWQAELDSGGYVGTDLIDLFKAYDCLSYDSLIPKLKAYGIDVGSLNFLLDYLSLRKHG